LWLFPKGFWPRSECCRIEDKKSFFLVNISTSGTSTVKPFKPVLGSTTFWRVFGALLAHFWRAFGVLFWLAFGALLARFWRAFGALLARFWCAFGLATFGGILVTLL
jgi:hypothetical protein